MSLFDSASLICTPNGVKAGKLYSIKPSDGAGDLDVVRATSATRVNANGLIESVGNNIARLDYSNASCPSILVEPQRTNLLLRSEEFNDAYWSKIDTSISANNTIAPDGTNTADTMVISAGTSRILPTLTTGAGTFTVSCYIKRLTGDANFQFRLVTDGANQIKNISITQEWQRYDFTVTATTSITQIQFRSGGGTGNIAIWGAQLEAGSTATSYIPTVASAVTRNADVISKTGISSLIGQTEGTIFVNAEIDFDKSNFTILGSTYVNGGTPFTHSVYFYINNNKIDGQIWWAPAFTGWTAFSSTLTNGRHKIAIAWKANDFAYCINGVIVASSTAYSNVPVGMNRFDVGDYYSSYKTTNSYNQTILFPTRLTNAQLQALTTL